MSTERGLSRGLAAVVASCFAIGAAIAAWSAGLGASLDDRVGDSFFRMRSAARGTGTRVPSVSVVGLSDRDAESLGLAGMDREPFARLARALSGAGAEAVIMDVSFPDRGGSPGDGALVAAAADAGNVYLPILLRPDRGPIAGGGPLPAGGQPRAVSPLPPGTVWRPTVSRGGEPLSASLSAGNFPALEAAAAGLGHFNSEPDRDGTFRRMPMLIRYGDGFVPCLALRAACDALGVDPGRIDVAFGDRIRLPGATMADGTVRDIDVPIDRRGMAVVDFPGPWERSFTYYPFSAIVATLDDPTLAEEARSELYGARLVVADLTTSASDYGPSPIEGVYPLSGMHAAMLDSLLSARFVRAPRWYEAGGWLVALALGLWALARALGPASFSAAAAACLALVALGQFAAFAALGVMPALAAPLIGTGLSVVVAGAYRYLRSERERSRTRARMERYFAPAVIEKILRSPDRLMSAERKVVTILFSDVAGFTCWCSERQPDEIHATLNRYFEMMTDIVFRNGGTVDKFIGDGLMAFFGDPVDQPDQEIRAVRTAVEMQRALRDSRATPEAAGGLRLRARIGINSGEVIVGDMGSGRVMAYTAIGAHVNLSSRLEGKAPVDGILVSEPVFNAVKDSFEARYAGRTTAKGIPGEFDTWEILVP
ncbi:MAG: adenylate/guanylate cyclase domain-containing protein [Spirochaetes bacterium]|nr:adenylate/guanylate cyclase domain-containing protein [Spirochaetota bacterium]